MSGLTAQQSETGFVPNPQRTAKWIQSSVAAVLYRLLRALPWCAEHDDIGCGGG
jgi:hypothetical protein